VESVFGQASFFTEEGTFLITARYIRGGQRGRQPMKPAKQSLTEPRKLDPRYVAVLEIEGMIARAADDLHTACPYPERDGRARA
jgi:hypothetical protein